MKKEALQVYAITDRSWEGRQTLKEQVKDALEGGITFLQLREKHLTGEALLQEAKEIQALCKEYGIPFIINDDVELAKKIDADGVHVGQSDMEMKAARKMLGPNKIIGVTAKTLEQAKAAEEAGADYLGSGAVFGTTTKQDAKPMSLDLLQEICESVSIPVVAIGGITKENLPLLKGRKMSGFAIVSGIFAAEDIKSEVKEIVELSKDVLA